MQSDNSPEYSSHHHHHQIAGINGSCCFPATRSSGGSCFTPTELLEIRGDRDPRASASSENHREAERKRRERINAHLDRLRDILLCNSKTDKASLLAKAVQRIRELKREISRNMQTDETLILPSDTDEIAVCQNDNEIDGKRIIVASLCCEDRVGLVGDLIEVLKEFPLCPLRAEMVTLGGRIRTVIFFAGENNRIEQLHSLLRTTMEAVVLRSEDWSGGGRLNKRAKIV